MSKILKIGGIIIVIGAALYLFFILFVSPQPINDKEILTRTFIDNVADAEVCNDYFNPETINLCTTFSTLMATEDYEYQLASLGDDILVIFSDDTDTVTFKFTFIEEPNSGISGFFHKVNYYIDTIE